MHKGGEEKESKAATSHSQKGNRKGRELRKFRGGVLSTKKKLEKIKERREAHEKEGDQKGDGTTSKEENSFSSRGFIPHLDSVLKTKKTLFKRVRIKGTGAVN